MVLVFFPYCHQIKASHFHFFPFLSPHLSSPPHQFTYFTMSFSDELFPSSLISREIQAIFPDGYTLRPLRRSDYHRGHLDVLRCLTHVGDIPESAWTERFDWMKGCSGTYYTVVIVDRSREDSKSIIGTGTLVAEKKLFVPPPNTVLP